MIEEHQDRTAEFVQLNSQLRERHDLETRELNEKADAIIYLVGEVARSTDEEFLKKFAETTGGRSSARNAIGVMSKIELQPEVLARRQELSEKIAGQLTDTLNTVVPVASGVHRALDLLLRDDRAELTRAVETLRRIRPETLDMLLDDPAFFTDLDLPECPVSTIERRELLGEMNWAVFTTVASVAANRALSIDEVAGELEDISGFGPLWDILVKHFIERGHILRCYRIIRDAQKFLNQLKFTYLPQRRKELRREKERLERFVRFIKATRRGSCDGHGVGRIRARQPRRNPSGSRTGETLLGLERRVGIALQSARGIQRRLRSLAKASRLRPHLLPGRANELMPLLGQYGGEVEKRLPPGRMDVVYAGERQRYWKRKRDEAPHGTVQYVVADQAFDRYALILDELLAKTGK